MERNEIEACLSKAEQQEERLRFPRFGSMEAWELGQFLVERVYAQGIDLAICIRRLNGAILFQHMTQGASLNNQNWMQRKFNTVLLMERSSISAWYQSLLSGKTLQMQGLSEQDYALCGGGFPIRLKKGEMVGILTVSNLPHEQDHGFIVDALEKWLI